eukprot:11173114-Lingulodinium_polyedra.AAC.1
MSPLAPVVGYQTVCFGRAFTGPAAPREVAGTIGPTSSSTLGITRHRERCVRGPVCTRRVPFGERVSGA